MSFYLSDITISMRALSRNRRSARIQSDFCKQTKATAQKHSKADPLINIEIEQQYIQDSVFTYSTYFWKKYTKESQEITHLFGHN